MENKVYFKTQINKNHKVTIILILIFIITLASLIMSFVPVKAETECEFRGKFKYIENYNTYPHSENDYLEIIQEQHKIVASCNDVDKDTSQNYATVVYFTVGCYNIYGKEIKEVYASGLVNTLCVETFRFYNEPHVIYKWNNSHLNNKYIYVQMIISGVLALLLVFYLFVKIAAKKCTLELNQDGIFGKKKTLFSLKSINQPFEKIDNIYVRDSIIDKLLGGKTIAVRSTSSCIKFSCIANAQEFVDKTLEELKNIRSL